MSETGDDAPRNEFEHVHRKNAIDVILENPKKDKYLMSKMEKISMHAFCYGRNRKG